MSLKHIDRRFHIKLCSTCTRINEIPNMAAELFESKFGRQLRPPSVNFPRDIAIGEQMLGQFREMISHRKW